jgi:hypothetical protein
VCRYMQLLLKKLTRKKLSKVLLKVFQGKFLSCGKNDERRLKESSGVLRACSMVLYGKWVRKCEVS